jgi:hypothetical protein
VALDGMYKRLYFMRKDFNLGKAFPARCPPEKVKSILKKLDFNSITTYTMEILQVNVFSIIAGVLIIRRCENAF